MRYSPTGVFFSLVYARIIRDKTVDVNSWVDEIRKFQPPPTGGSRDSTSPSFSIVSKPSRLLMLMPFSM